jgi:hypothetical protein
MELFPMRLVFYLRHSFNIYTAHYFEQHDFNSVKIIQAINSRDDGFR